MRAAFRALALVGRRDAAVGDPLGGVDDHLDAMSRLDQVIDAIERLSPEGRDLLVLVAWEGCSSEQASEVLLIPPGTVRSRLNRIRAMLRAEERAG